MTNTSEVVSIVLPVYNEEESIRPLFKSIVDAFEDLWEDLEVVFVDDGSSDRSAEIVKGICNQDDCVKLVTLARNFGHQLAITAGLEHACGTAVITMDADLQHPPSLIPKLIEKWKEGFDVVHTVRDGTEGIGLFKRFTSAAFYRLINSFVDIKIVHNAADFRLMDRKVVDHLNGMRERSRFVRGLVTWVGFRQTAIPYVAGKRRFGRTKYSLRRMLSFGADGITSFSTFPLRMSMYFGFAVALAGVPYAVWAIYARLFTETAVSGWASLIVAILFLGGVQLISLGVLGEYVGRIYEEVKGRPLYVVRERIGFEPTVHETSSATRNSHKIARSGHTRAVPEPLPASGRRHTS